LVLAQGWSAARLWPFLDPTATRALLALARASALAAAPLAVALAPPSG
jgi:hypothetical protein